MNWLLLIPITMGAIVLFVAWLCFSDEEWRRWSECTDFFTGLEIPGCREQKAAERAARSAADRERYEHDRGGIPAGNLW